jgi:diguanylate cyclase (GGDEF)-like protein
LLLPAALALIALDVGAARVVHGAVWRAARDALLLGALPLAMRLGASVRARRDAPGATSAPPPPDTTEATGAPLDKLTGLPQREAFETALAGAGAGLEPGRQLAVMALDLYQFGDFNQRWGQDCGDALLRELAARLRALPGDALLARVGADAFALAWSGLESSAVEARMTQVLGTLKAPFEVGGRGHAVTAALGVALYPADTAQVEALLGLAEAALFNRLQRLLGDVTTELDPYGALSAELMRWAGRFLRRRVRHLVEAFYTRLRADESSRRVLDLLGDDGAEHLQRKQESYLLQLLGAELDADWHAQRAAHLGHLHAMVGVPARALVAATSWYQLALTDLCQRIPGRLSQRQLLVRTISRRLEIDLTLQTEAAQALQLDLQKRLQRLAVALRGAQRWAEVMDATLDMVRHWPFLGFCAFYSQDAHGQFVLEARTPGYDSFAQALRDAGGDAQAQPALRRGWSSGRLETVCGGAALRVAAPELAAALSQGGLRSAAVLPVDDGQGRIQAVIMIYGRLPNQFDTPWMNDLLLNLQQTLSQTVHALRQATPPRVSADDRALWRRRLFDGGLAMHLQPIVSLADRRCVKVETLARLQLADGRVISPGQFLPVLSDQELNRLFIEGLHLSLDHLETLQRDGLELELSFNLPPGTLRHRDCLNWIRSALAPRHIEPRRVTFELLENEDIADQQSYTRAILGLHELGVKLAMDDLGSGYSSLQRLRTLPFDLVKIDQGLLHAAELAPQRSIALLGALVRLAQGLDLRVAIEGLETDERVELAQILGADLAQGYALARPMPASELPGWLGTQGRPHPPRAAATRMGALAAHWLWEQGDQDAAAPDPGRAHLHCAIGHFIALHGLQHTPLAAHHAEMHLQARAGGVHGAAYLHARDAFYAEMLALDVDATDAMLLN